MTRVMRIYFNAEAGEEIHIRQIRLNVAEPIFMHAERIAFLWLLGMLLVIFGPRSWIYTTRLNLRESRQFILVVVILILNLTATTWAGKAADPSVWRELRDDRDYQEKEYELYAEALLQGHSYLDIRPPRALTSCRFESVFSYVELRGAITMTGKRSSISAIGPCFISPDGYASA